MWSQEDGIHLLLVAILIAILLGYYIESRRVPRHRWNMKRGNTMTPEERGVYLSSRIADAIVDGIEDLVFKGKMSTQEAKTWYHRLSSVFGLKDLKPRNIKGMQKALKAELRMRRRNGKTVPVHIPDETTVKTPPRNKLQALIQSRLKAKGANHGA